VNWSTVLCTLPLFYNTTKKLLLICGPRLKIIHLPVPTLIMSSTNSKSTTSRVNDLNTNEANANDGLLWYWGRSCKLALERMFTHWLILGILIAMSLFLITLRATFIECIPFLQKHIKLSVVFIDAFADTFVVLEDIIKVIVRIIQDIAHLFSHKHKVPPFHFIKFVKLNDNELRAMLTEFAISPALCPVVRSLAPTKLHAISSSLFSWLVFNPDPLLNSDSCVVNTMYKSIDIAAAASAVGFILIELVIPIYFGIIVLYTLSWPTYCILQRLYQKGISFLSGSK